MPVIDVRYKADPMVARRPEYSATALEQRAEIEPLEALHAERRELAFKLNPLKARFGNFGTWDDLRKSHVEAMKVQARTNLVDAGAKVTEGLVDAMAYSDPDYRALLDRAEMDRIEYLNLEVLVRELDERIRNRELALTAYSAEARLAR